MSDEIGADRDPLRLLPDFHRSTRMPLDAVVRLHFEGTVAYQNGFAANVSALGMFVKHPEPPEVGTQLVFEFVLGDERKPVQGGGVVTWVRERYEGPGRPAGIGIQFTELDALSRQHIAEALFEYLEMQLGVEIADHPDVPDLLAAMPSSTMVEVGDDDAATRPGIEEPQSAIRFEPTADWTSDERADEEPEPAPDATPFRVFGNGSDPLEGLATDSLDRPREEIFSPITPPEPIDALDDSAVVYGAARRRESPPWLPVVIALAITAGGLLAWWYLWGPGAEARRAEAPVAAAAPAAARPRLDPRPGPDTTLAQAVGVADEATAEAPTGPTDEPAEVPATETPTPPVATAEPAAEGVTAPAEPASVGTARMSRVTDVRWRSSADGTEVILVGDGAFAPGSYRWFEMRDERPRVLVRLTGVAAGYPRPSLDVGTFEVAGIRVGFHQKPAGNELHVVLDLASADVRVAGVEAQGDRLVVRLHQP